MRLKPTLEGERYEGLKEVIFIAVIDFVMFPDKSDYRSTQY
ncbi:hypothetical protein MHYMCMPSP_00391 [Hyalomma marginatum]|uniref:Uncharacterized protein n=1 Tax=Hyalomma marginatum TaxID=34627 RepID=A0A8S4C104_9ACAR|nr:hypothetical protein MHYMCMPASI_00179 [Hyalomma marginatum]CAG7590973.1 hypothetical protein MHYMCMPSP_00391 [Hyalomma marginatum]